jgi:hypothetical protein
LGAGPIAGLGNFGSATTPTRFELKKEKQPRNSKRHDYGALCNRGRKLCVGVALHRQLQSQHKLSEKTLSEMRKLFEARGGFRVFLLAHGAHDLYERARQSQRELRYVYWIVDYLCRCKKYVSDGDKLDIETAKQFVAQCAPERENTFGLSKIEKIWLTYKDAAPYIFAFYGILSRGLKQKASPDEVMEFIAKLASDGPRLKKLIGRAAYAADILNGLAFDVRINDFKNSERAVPPLHSFNTVKSTTINNIDRNAPIA